MDLRRRRNYDNLARARAYETARGSGDSLGFKYKAQQVAFAVGSAYAANRVRSAVVNALGGATTSLRGTVSTFNSPPDYLGDSAPLSVATAAPLQPPTRMPKRTYEQVNANREAAVKRLRTTKATNPARYAAMRQGVQGPRPPVELKCVDINSTTVTLDSVSTTSGIPLNLMQSGSGFNERVGRKVFMQSLYFTGCIRPLASNVTYPRYIRIAIVYDSQSNGTTPQYSDVFNNFNENDVAQSNAFSHLNLNNRERFRVIMDKRLQLGCGGAAATNSAVIPSNTIIQEYRRLNNLETVYGADSSPASAADVRSGTLWLFTNSDCPGGAATEGLVYTLRLRYTD